MQTLPCASSGTDANDSALNDSCVHQHGDSVLAADAMAHSFDWPQSGHEPLLDATDTSSARASKRNRLA